MTEAGKRHVDWLVRANIPTFSGELYRSNFQASVAGIEAEAVAAERARIVTQVHQELAETKGDPEYMAGFEDAMATVLRIVSGESDA